LDPTTPAYVAGGLMKLLAANALATAVLPLLVPGNDFVCAIFLDPIARELYGDIEDRQAAAAAGLRAFAGPDAEDPQLTELVGELSVRSSDPSGFPDIVRSRAGTAPRRSARPATRPTRDPPTGGASGVYS